MIPHNGRKNTGKWNEIHDKWISQIDGTAESDETKYIRHKINKNGEALPDNLKTLYVIMLYINLWIQNRH